MDELVKENTLHLDLSSLSKKHIVVDVDNEQRDLYLDLSDMNILVRLKEKLPELEKLQASATEKLQASANDPDAFAIMTETLKEIDSKMREVLNVIFDADVASVCAPSGNMFDFINGRTRYEIIFDGLVSLFDNNITAEAKKLEKRVNNNKHTAKYVH